MNVTSGLVVYPAVIRQRVMRELPFMATENIMMNAVKQGGDRQALHEKIREYSMLAGKRVKEEGLDNNLCELILQDPAFFINEAELQAMLQPENFTGRSAQQVDEFLKECVAPVLKDAALAQDVALTV